MFLISRSRTRPSTRSSVSPAHPDSLTEHLRRAWPRQSSSSRRARAPHHGIDTRKACAIDVTGFVADAACFHAGAPVFADICMLRMFFCFSADVVPGRYQLQPLTLWRPLFGGGKRVACTLSCCEVVTTPRPARRRRLLPYRHPLRTG